ncbi:hypothetical protein PR048_019274 [Dryococelus australis]|uniref:Uncharacterized protein n=1 Tax=Dryococelus australis TaxID=614101 RepID=A0ABQ9H320_9NEOP|nr:hypothetical protein PR048_019274 [Dryococelus australis]
MTIFEPGVFPTKPNLVRFQAKSPPDFRSWESCWMTMTQVGGFPRGSLPLHAGAAPYPLRFTHVGSQDLAVKSRPTLFTHSLHSYYRLFALWEFSLRHLTIDRKHTSGNVCLSLVRKLTRGHLPSVMITTGDETWIYDIDPDTEQQSSQWKDSRALRSKKKRSRFRSTQEERSSTFSTSVGLSGMILLLRAHSGELAHHVALAVVLVMDKSEFGTCAEEGNPSTSSSDPLFNDTETDAYHRPGNKPQMLFKRTSPLYPPQHERNLHTQNTNQYQNQPGSGNPRASCLSFEESPAEEVTFDTYQEPPRRWGYSSEFRRRKCFTPGYCRRKSEKRRESKGSSLIRACNHYVKLYACPSGNQTGSQGRSNSPKEDKNGNSAGQKWSRQPTPTTSDTNHSVNSGGQFAPPPCQLVENLHHHRANWWTICTTTVSIGGQFAPPPCQLVDNLHHHRANWWTICTTTVSIGGQLAPPPCQLVAPPNRMCSNPVRNGYAASNVRTQPATAYFSRVECLNPCVMPFSAPVRSGQSDEGGRKCRCYSAGRLEHGLSLRGRTEDLACGSLHEAGPITQRPDRNLFLGELAQEIAFCLARRPEVCPFRFARRNPPPPPLRPRRVTK